MVLNFLFICFALIINILRLAILYFTLIISVKRRMQNASMERRKRTEN